MDTARMPATADPLAIVSLSGGMDSTTLLGHYADHERGYRLLAVSVDYGQRNVRELDAARAIAAHYDVEHLIVDLRAVGALLSGSALTDPRSVRGRRVGAGGVLDQGARSADGERRRARLSRVRGAPPAAAALRT